jgi:hypothetical protein
MRRAYGPPRCRFVGSAAKGVSSGYDFRRNALGPANDAAVSRSLLLFAAAEVPERKSLVTQYAPNPPQQSTERPSNGLGTAGFVLGLIGLLFSFIPVIGMIAWPLVILGVIFSAIGISKANKGRATNKGLAIAGLVVSVVGLAMCILWVAVLGKAANDIDEEANREAVIVYEVSGDATNVNVTYTTFGDSMTSNQETAATLPWTKEMKTKGLVKEGQLIVTTGETGGTVTCKVTVDGKEVKTATATGVLAIATCDSF